MLTQRTRMLELTTPLGDDRLLLTALEGREALSEPFSFELEMLSDDNQITPEQMLGQRVGVRMAAAGGDTVRSFDGYISAFSGGIEDDQGRRQYSATMVPWLWFLTRTADCRVFQDLSVPQIIEKVFDDCPFANYDLGQLSREYEPREFCLQYRETDFQFVSRLMEEEGIFYYFEHTDGAHLLRLADQAKAYTPCVQHEVDLPRDSGTRCQTPHLKSWDRQHKFRSGRWTQTDYNYLTPKHNLLTSEATVCEQPGAEAFEFYDYPGRHQDTAQGMRYSRLRMEAEEIEYHRVRATSNCDTFVPGGVFTVGQHRSASEQGGKFVILSVQHSIRESAAYETGQPPEVDYENRLECMPDGGAYRPRECTPKPKIHGIQSAVVVGPDDQEIYTDAIGRVKLQFHWDRQGRYDEQSSIWVRVAQSWAGPGWGTHYWPRIGHEVLIVFINGNPDLPLIIGSAYNAANMPPYPLPEQQDVCGIKTRSTPDGGPDNFNELRFDDRKDEELIYMHAERDLTTIVENDEARRIDNNRTTVVTETDRLVIEKGNRETYILEGDDILEVRRGNVGKAAPAGNYDISSKEINLTGSDRITLTVGGSSIVLEPGMITIDSPTIISQAGGLHLTKGNTVASHADATHSTQGPVVVSAADCVNEIKGGIVTIN